MNGGKGKKRKKGRKGRKEGKRSKGKKEGISSKTVEKYPYFVYLCYIGPYAINKKSAKKKQ